MPFCGICFEEVEIDEKTGFCSECSKIMGEEEKEKVSIRTVQSRWDETDQIFFLNGMGWATSPTGRSFILGKEEEIVGAINAREIPKEVGTLQKEEYERIFRILEENNEQGRTKNGSGRVRKSNIRASKTGKRSNKRIRSVSGSRGRNKHPRTTKTTKRASLPPTRLKK